jgi:uncharacterized protein YecE (DUF72 family)
VHFGRVANIEQANLALPDDSLRTTRFLDLDSVAETNVYIGCPIWSSKQWLGTVYPKGTKANQYLKEYAKKFRCVEVNSTFYHPLDAGRIASWRDEVGPDFKFCPKAYRGITERLDAADIPVLIKQYCEAIRAFDDNLGLVFAQLPETFSPNYSALLQRLILCWPEDVPLAVELRHPGWFADHRILDQVVNFFYKHHIATVITDTPGRRDALHLSLTQPRVLIRFQGHNFHDSDKLRLAEWSARLKEWSGKNLSEVYFFVHQPDDETIPQATQHMIDLCL